MGEVEKDDGVLVIRRIHVTYHLEAEPDRREAIDRAYEHHARFCPVYRSVSGCIDVTTELELIAAPD